MTDDTLRGECELLFRKIAMAIDNPEWTEHAEDMLVAFARAQQAKGLREAGVEAAKRVKSGDIQNIYSEIELPRLAVWCEAQAATWEKQT